MMVLIGAVAYATASTSGTAEVFTQVSSKKMCSLRNQAFVAFGIGGAVTMFGRMARTEAYSRQ